MENLPPEGMDLEIPQHVKRTLWTVWADYFATGEGRTISACIVYAHDEESALSEFKRIVDGGDFYVLGAYAQRGVIENDFTRFVFSNNVFEFCNKENEKANISVSGQFYFNFS